MNIKESTKAKVCVKTTTKNVLKCVSNQRVIH